ncbi:MAG TPA: sulfotransferase, partial [Caulobacteraceae bacterium]|nr:sulfotransferase [Caulobacteraceae bacterium]
MAARAYALAERGDPADFRATLSLATLDLRQGRPAAALPRLRRAVVQWPGLYAAAHNLGAAAQALSLWDEAAGAYARALALRPEATETRVSLAAVLTVLGRPDEAAAHRSHLAADPAERAGALTRQALLDPAAVTDAGLADMRRAAADPASDRGTVAGLQFGLGEVLEQRGEDDAAFAAFAEGNRLKRQAFADDPASDPAALLRAHREAAELIARTFTTEFLERRRGAGLATGAPIFIVGMPRCGSTLIEQILASHPQVTALGETAILPRLLEGGELLEAAG